MNVGDLLFMLNFHDKNINVKLEFIDDEYDQKFFAKLVQVYEENGEIILSGDIEL